MIVKLALSRLWTAIRTLDSQIDQAKIAGMDDEDLIICAIDYLAANLMGAFPLAPTQIFHITINGQNGLCGAKDEEEPTIHMAYAKSTLITGVWCPACKAIIKNKYGGTI